MALRLNSLLFSIVSILPIYAQEIDSLIYAEGNVLSAESKEPINAHITYKSLPYGNRIGSVTNTSFSFPMFDNEKYLITIEAPGYKTVTHTLDPHDVNAEKKVRKDVELNLIPDIEHFENPSAGQLLRLNTLIFQVGKAKVSPDSYEELNAIVKMMKDNKAMIVQLEGHTDYQGDSKDNMKLSKDRVDAVKEYLASKGIDRARIKTKALGGTMPISKDDTPKAHSLNRRVELRILEN